MFKFYHFESRQTLQLISFTIDDRIITVSPETFSRIDVLSGAVEPIGAVLTILAASLIVPAMPYLLSFAAGAMIYVVVEELIPEMSAGEHSDIGVLMFSLGFTLMMALDVALG